MRALRPLFLCCLALTLPAALQAQSVLLAGYDFQTTANGGTAAAASPNSPLVYLANFGAQAGAAGLYLNGTNGSSAFVSAGTGNEVTGATGTTVNAGADFNPSTANPAALSLRGGTNQSANGKSLVFVLSTTGYQGLVLSFATVRSTTGFTGNTFSYSTDGTSFTAAAAPVTAVTPGSNYALVTEDFSSLASLNNASTVYIRYTLAGATGSTGSNFLDNVQFNASPVPEPATVFGGCLLVGALGWQQWRRRR